MLIWCHMASSNPRPRPLFAEGRDEAPATPAETAAELPEVPRSKACRTPSKYSLRFLSKVATRRSLLVGRYPSKTCHVMALTSEGTPDQAVARSSVRDMVL